MKNKITKLSKFNKQVILMSLDILSIIFSFFAAFYIRFGYFYLPGESSLWLIILSPFFAIPIFSRFRLYKSILRYFDYDALWNIAKAVSLYSVILGLIIYMTKIDDMPRSVALINWLITLLFIIGLRMFARWFLTSSQFVDAKRVVIYGAGSAGIQLSIALKQSKELNPIAFIDDNLSLTGRSIHGITILSLEQAKEFLEKNNIEEVLLALPSISRERRNEIFDQLVPFGLSVRSVPGVSQLARGKVKIEDLQEIKIADLLGRESVAPIDALLKKNILGKVVMVTGAGGSIGSEICRQVARLKPKTLIMLDNSEFLLYSIESEISSFNKSDFKLLAVLGSINNTKRLFQVLSKFKVDTIYHAAAYKHVPMVEFNLSEGIENNVFGTLNCARLAVKANVKTFVLISTDKAVRPTNAMGASKRLAELILQALSRTESPTKFTIVRFGNVLGSSGSVIPAFKKQIEKGGPVTVTDKKMVRYFMTIPEAVELVIQSGAMGKSGDVFVLDMGEPVSIDLLARKMIQLSGLKLKESSEDNGDIEIVYCGLRPGEKLYEELLIGGDISKTEHPMIFSAEEEMIEWPELKVHLDNLKHSIDELDFESLRMILQKSISGYKPQGEIVDILKN